MEILTEEEFAMRVDYRRPLHPAPEERESAWCIPFEYGSNEKGTKISIPLAKQIAAELFAAVAEAEKRALRRAFDREQARSKEIAKQYSEMSDKWMSALGEVHELKKKMRKRRSKERRR